MPLNLATAQNWNILLGAAELDISGCVDGWILQRTKAELDRPVTTRLEADLLAESPNAPFGFSMLPTAAIWKKGQQVKVLIDGVLVATLVLQSFDYDFDDCRVDGDESPGGQLIAVCRLSLESRTEKIEPFGPKFFAEAKTDRMSGSTYKKVVPWTKAAGLYLNRAGIPLADTSGNTIVLRTRGANGEPRTDGLSAEPPNPNPDPIAEAQSIAQSRGCWLWVKPDGSVVARKYPMPPYGSPAVRISRDLLFKNKLERLEVGDEFEPPQRTNVVGRENRAVPEWDTEEFGESEFDDADDDPTDGQRQPCEDGGGDKRIITPAGYIVIDQPRVKNGIGSLNYVKYREEQYTEKNVLFPGSDSNALVRERLEERVVYYDREGKPLSALTKKTIPAGLASSQLYPEQTNDYYAERIEEIWEYDLSGLWLSHRRDVYKRMEIIFNTKDAGGGFAIAHRTLTNYLEVACDKWSELVSEFVPEGVKRPDPDRPFSTTLVKDSNNIPTELDGAPEPPYKPTPQPIVPDSYQAEDERPGLTSDEDDERDGQTIYLDHINSQEQADEVAKLLGQMFESRRWARSIERPLDRATLKNLDLFAVEDVCKSRGIVDGFSILCAEGEILCSYTLQFVGDLANPVPPRTSRAVSVPPAPGVSNPVALNPEPDYSFQQGESVEIVLLAQCGSQPYTYSTTTLPAGLTLSGDTISGNPTATGTTTITATVTDDSSDTDSVSFDVVVAAVAPAATRSKRVIRGIAEDIDEAYLAEPPPPVTGIGEDADEAIGGIFLAPITAEIVTTWGGEIRSPLVAEITITWGGEIERIEPSIDQPSLQLWLDPDLGLTSVDSGFGDWDVQWDTQSTNNSTAIARNEFSLIDPYSANAFGTGISGLRAGDPVADDGWALTLESPFGSQNYISSTAYTIFVVFEAIGFNASTNLGRNNLYGNSDGVIGDGFGFGVYLREIGGNYELVLGNDTGTTQAEVYQSATLNTIYLVEAWHDGTDIHMKVNDGTEQTTPAGARTSNGDLFIGGWYDRCINGYIGHVLVYNGALDQATRDGIRAELNGIYGAY